MEVVARHADWWNVPVHHLDRLDETRERAGDARVSVQIFCTAITDETDATRSWAETERRFRLARGSARLEGNGPELRRPASDALADRGIERVSLWFTDFAQPATLEWFGPNVLVRRWAEGPNRHVSNRQRSPRLSVRIRFRAAISRSSILLTLPAAISGSSVTIETRRGDLVVGHLRPATTRSRSARVEARPGRGTTKAMPTSPIRSSGMPTTATWPMPGWPATRFSISAG